jgi:O-6-methylguanine DNA methyltransferase
MNTTMLSSPPATGPVVGVRTTRIYCRPVCRAGRAPRAENCIPFPDAEAARAAGFRPCKQCRPDDPEPPARPRRRDEARAFSGELTVRYATAETPFGVAFVAATDRGVCALYFLPDDDPAPGLERLRKDIKGATITFEFDPSVAFAIDRAVGHIDRGEPCDDVALDLRGTPFQRAVWDALRAIPRGETTTYGALAVKLGLPPGAARAVGTACGSNRVSLIVPCHRVLAAGGGLGGYYWGLDLKRELLEREQLPAGLA